MSEFSPVFTASRAQRWTALLLGGTALVALTPAAIAQQAADPVALSPITVQSDETQTAADGSIVAEQASGGGKLTGDLLDVAASVSVITEAEIKRRNASNMEEVLQYTSGVQTNFYGSDDRFDYFKVRGFDAYAYRDGLSVGATFGAAREEPLAFERVEVVKGASAAALGASDPGGAVNYTTRRPKLGRHAEVYTTLGNNNHAEIGFDFGDDLNEDASLSYRLTGKVQDAEKDYGASRDDELFLQGGLTWRPTAQTELTFVAEHLNQDNVPGSGGYPVGVDTPRSAFFGEPDYNYRGTERSTYTALLSHDFGTGLSLSSTLRYSEEHADFGYVYVSGSAGGTDLTRAQFTNDESGTKLAGNVVLDYRTNLGAVGSHTRFGLEYLEEDSTSALWWVGVSNIDYANPVYSGISTNQATSPYNDTDTFNRTTAVFINQEFDFGDRVIANIGLRHDHLELSQTNNLTNTTTSGTFDELTGSAGLTYKLTRNSAIFASYAESVVPAGLTVEPERGEQYELGFKYRPANGRALFSASLFDLSRTNLTRTNPATGLQDTIGKVRVRGLDLEAKAELSEAIALTAAYSYLDSEIVENGTSGNEGNNLAYVPEHMASVWVDYTLKGTGTRGDMTFGLGARFTGSYFFNDANTASTGSNIVYDAAFSYHPWDNTELAVNVSNLFDDKHVAYGGFGADWYSPGRTISATLRHSF